MGNWGVGLEVEGIVDVLISPQRSHGNHTIIDLAQVRQVLSADMNGLVTSFSIPVLINHQHPCSLGAVNGSSSNKHSRLCCTARSSQSDSERNHCSACARGCCAPTTGSVLAKPVRVLWRSLGRSNPSGSGEIPRAGSVCRRWYQNAVHTLPRGVELSSLVVVWSSFFPPLPRCITSIIPRQLPLQQCSERLSLR